MTYQLENVRVLIVEDNQPMLEIITYLLKAYGVKEVLRARDGEEGFKIFCREDPDFAIVDWMMQPVDGISFTKMVRRDSSSPNPYCPIILISGFSEKQRVTTARDAGVTEFLVKPFTARDLYKRVVQIVERPRQFVRSPDFFGPDRRRKRDPNFEGERKRTDDVREPDKPRFNPEDIDFR